MPLIVTTAIIASIFTISYFGDYRYNYSPSIPGLIWQITDATPDRGDTVVVCLPARFVERHGLRSHLLRGASCGSVQPLLKRIAGLGGDHVAIGQDGIRVNGQMIAHSARIITPTINVDGNMVLGEDAVVVVGDTPDSLDSRYFGAVDLQWVRTARRIL